MDEGIKEASNRPLASVCTTFEASPDPDEVAMGTNWVKTPLTISINRAI
jgi:hypothetical protein